MVTSYTATVHHTGLYFGEAPRWHDGRLWFSDFYRHGVFSLGDDGERRELTVEPQPSGLGWRDDGTLLVVFFGSNIGNFDPPAAREFLREIRQALHTYTCKRAILVGHNAGFDLGFLNAVVERAAIKRNPFHPFSSFDTATLGGVAFGQTVLMRATLAAGLEWDTASAHSAAYDAERTADLFCTVCNQFQGVFDASRRRLAAMGPLEVEPSVPGEPL